MQVPTVLAQRRKTTLCTPSTVRGVVRDGIRGTPQELIRVALLLFWLVRFVWLVVLLAT